MSEARSLIFLIFCVLPQGSNNKETEMENNNGLSGHQDRKSICPPEIFIDPEDEHKELMSSFSRT